MAARDTHLLIFYDRQKDSSIQRSHTPRNTAESYRTGRFMTLDPIVMLIVRFPVMIGESLKIRLCRAANLVTFIQAADLVA